LVVYFEDNSFSLVDKKDTLPFDLALEPFTTYQQTHGSEFLNNIAVANAINYLKFDSIPDPFVPWMMSGSLPNDSVESKFEQESHHSSSDEEFSEDESVEYKSDDDEPASKKQKTSAKKTPVKKSLAKTPVKKSTTPLVKKAVAKKNPVPYSKPIVTPLVKPIATPLVKPSTTPLVKPSTTTAVKPSTTTAVKPSTTTAVKTPAAKKTPVVKKVDEKVMDTVVKSTGKSFKVLLKLHKL
jgi:hypothetical protein